MNLRRSLKKRGLQSALRRGGVTSSLSARSASSFSSACLGGLGKRYSHTSVNASRSDSSLDRTNCISESAAASPFAKSAVS